MRIQPYKEAPRWDPGPWTPDGGPTSLARWAEDREVSPAEMTEIILALRTGEYVGGGPPDLEPAFRLVCLDPVIGDSARDD